MAGANLSDRTAATASLRDTIAGSGPAFIIYDLEVTSWEGALARDWSGPGEFPEIIQIGAIKLASVMDHAELDSFSCLVRPTKNPLLSSYITELTGITQADVDTRGVPFVEAVSGFARFAAGCQALSNGVDNEWMAANCRLPDVPTFAEAGVQGIEVEQWRGIVVPAKTPPEIVSRLNAEIAKILADPAVRGRFLAQAIEPVGGSIQQFAAQITDDYARYGTLVKQYNIKVE